MEANMGGLIGASAALTDTIPAPSEVGSVKGSVAVAFLVGCKCPRRPGERL